MNTYTDQMAIRGARRAVVVTVAPPESIFDASAMLPDENDADPGRGGFAVSTGHLILAYNHRQAERIGLTLQRLGVEPR